MTNGRRTRRELTPPRRGRSSLTVFVAGLALGGALGAAILAVLTVLASPPPVASPPPARAYTCGQLLQPPAEAASGEAVATEDLGGEHVPPGTRLTYRFCPPTSGPHFNAPGAGPLRPGFYGPDDGVGPGGWVHNLEHGYVVALYRCAGGSCPSEDDLAALRAFAEAGPPTSSAAACGYRSKVLVARFDDMSTPFALLAWNRALLVPEFSSSDALDFASRSIDATAPEPAAC